MQQKTSLGVEEGRSIVETILEAARETKPGRPSSVAVVDNAGILIYFARMDGASPLTARMAINKAYTAIDTQRDTRDQYERIKDGRDVAWYGEPRMAPVPGGVLIRSSDGSIAGAVGTSGRTADEDEELALVGAGALKLA